MAIIAGNPQPLTRGLAVSLFLQRSNNLSDLTNAGTARTNLGLGTIATQAANNVTISGGSISGITDLAIADGGTGQSTAQAAIDALTAVASATNEHVLTKDTATGNAIFKAAAGGSSLPVADTQTIIKGSSDDTKLLRFEVDGFTTGTTRVITPPDANITLAGQNHANIFSVLQTIQFDPGAGWMLDLINESTLNQPMGIRLNSTDALLTAGSDAFQINVGGTRVFGVDWKNGTIFTSGLLALSGGPGNAPLSIGEASGGKAVEMITTAQHAYTYYQDATRSQDWAFGMGEIVLGTAANRGFGLFEGTSFASPNLPVWWVRKDSTRVGFATTDPLAQVHIDQSSTTGAIPVLTLDQADLSEEFIRLITTVGTGNPVEAVGAKTLTTTHFVRWYVEGVGALYMPLGTIA